ncbi:MAG: WD40 repeat domain-containing protein [Solirubrobacteraceae bacterium]
MSSAERVDAALRRKPTAEERRAEERAWAVVRAAAPSADRGGFRRGVRAWRPALVAAALVAAVLGVALTPPGDAVADLLRRVIGAPAVSVRPRPVAGATLPGGGALLASGRNGPVVVRGATATERLLGNVDEASWSPRGRFVVAIRGPEVIAVDRSGRRRWTVVAPGRIGRPRHPRWSPDGFRVAYVAPGELRVVAGDGTGDRALAPARASIAPAWRPRTAAGRHLVAYAERDGHVAVRDADTGTRLGRTRGRLAVRALAWTGDGTRLLVLTPTRTVWLTPGGTSTLFVSPPRGQHFKALAAAPRGRDYATVTTATRGARRSQISVVRAGVGRFLLGFPGTTRGLAFSPDGRWLAVASDAADAWLLLRPGARGLVAQRSIEDVRRRLGAGSTVRLEGWCCPR